MQPEKGLLGSLKGLSDAAMMSNGTVVLDPSTRQASLTALSLFLLPEIIKDRCLAINDVWRIGLLGQRVLAQSVPHVKHLGCVVIKQLPPIKQSFAVDASPLINGSRKEVLPRKEAQGRRARAGGHEQGGGKG